MLAAERKFVKPRIDTDWSIELHMTSMLCNYWSRVYKGIMNSRTVTTQIKIYYDKLSVIKQEEINRLRLFKSDYQLVTIAKGQMIKYLKYKQELTRYHKELCIKGLAHLVEICKELNEVKEAKIIEKIANTEMKKRDWAILENNFNPRSISGISNVEIPNLDANGIPTNDPDKAVDWTRVTNPSDIEEKLIERNTLFTRQDFKDNFHYDGTSSNATDLINGNFDIDTIPNLTEGARSLLLKLSSKPSTTFLDDQISYDEFKTAFQKWSEGTSTSPSGRHLGHYKVLLCSDNCSDRYDDKYKDPREDIMTVYYNIVIAALNMGISIDRWQNCTTTMIEKQPGNPKINKLRVIHLYEADYNAILKIVWARKVVWHAHNNDVLNNGQPGSRPIDVVTQKDQKYLFSRLTNTNIATMDNDAKSCYDRILCNLAMIISQYFGISKSSAAVQATTLRMMKFRLRTAIGNSTNTYQHSELTPIHGTGQGSCASPLIWLMISSILMDCLAQIGGGMTMQDVIDEQLIQQWIDGFVDDTSIFSSLLSGTQDSISQLQAKLCRDMTKWKELLEASRGKLE